MAAIKDQQSQQETFSIASLSSSVCIYIVCVYTFICMYDEMYV